MLHFSQNLGGVWPNPGTLKIILIGGENYFFLASSHLKKICLVIITKNVSFYTKIGMSFEIQEL